MTTPDPALVQAARAWIKTHMPPQPLEYTDEYIVKMVAAFGAAQRAEERARCIRIVAEHGCFCDANEIPEPVHVSSCPTGIAYALRAARPEGT